MYLSGSWYLLGNTMHNGGAPNHAWLADVYRLWMSMVATKKNVKALVADVTQCILLGETTPLKWRPHPLPRWKRFIGKIVLSLK